VPLFVGGDSAGGNLAAVTAIRARDNGAPELAGQILLCPVTDSDVSRASYLEPENQSFLTTDHAVVLEPLCPSRPSDPRGIPTEHRFAGGSGTSTGDHRRARHSSRRRRSLRARLEESGVDVEHHRWQGQMHAFFSMVNVLPASADVMDLVAGSLRTRAAAAESVAG
jgi:acetyl esterase